MSLVILDGLRREKNFSGVGPGMTAPVFYIGSLPLVRNFNISEKNRYSESENSHKMQNVSKSYSWVTRLCRQNNRSIYGPLIESFKFYPGFK